MNCCEGPTSPNVVVVVLDPLLQRGVRRYLSETGRTSSEDGGPLKHAFGSSHVVQKFGPHLRLHVPNCDISPMPSSPLEIFP